MNDANAKPSACRTDPANPCSTTSHSESSSSRLPVPPDGVWVQPHTESRAAPVPKLNEDRTIEPEPDCGRVYNFGAVACPDDPSTRTATGGRLGTTVGLAVRCEPPASTSTWLFHDLHIRSYILFSAWIGMDSRKKHGEVTKHTHIAATGALLPAGPNRDRWVQCEHQAPGNRRAVSARPIACHG